MKHAVASLALTAGTIAAASIALAGMSMPLRMDCGSSSGIDRNLSQKYKEAPVWKAVTAGGSILEIWADPTGKGWTMLFRLPQGISCVAATGTDGFETSPLSRDQRGA